MIINHLPTTVFCTFNARFYVTLYCNLSNYILPILNSQIIRKYIEFLQKS